MASSVLGSGPLPRSSTVAVTVASSPISAACLRSALAKARSAAACRAAGIPIAGGHTIDSVEPIYGLVAIGLVDPAHLKRNSGALAGDVLILGKPLGVGIFSAALKKGALDEAGYARMLESTTRLNAAGPDLARLPGVHAMTDVTGFGLAGHALEMARGSNCQVRIDWSAVPLLEGAFDLAAAGFVTGASGRNWASYGQDVTFAREMGAIDKALKKAGWKVEDVDLWEINEAFAVVPMALMADLKVPHEKVNVNGGACALGHPIGASGARIIVTLLHALQARGKKKGLATLCIGGGEATAMAIELV